MFWIGLDMCSILGNFVLDFDKMKYQYVAKGDNERLILVFAGWAMDYRPFAGLRRPGYDIVVFWDFRDFCIDWTFCAGYNEICVVAWSFGVYAAAATTGAIDRKITRRIAVNGTLYPVDRRRGIPENIFQGTLNGLNERNLDKFYHRVCGSIAAFRNFCENKPERGINELAEELQTFVPTELLQPTLSTRWDLAIISSNDAIFPAVNQWRAWQGTPIEMNDGPHMPCIQNILDRYILDKQRVGERFESGLPEYEANAPVQNAVAARIVELMDIHGVSEHIGRRGSRTLEIGSGTGVLSRELDSLCGADAYLEMWDIAGAAPIEGHGRKFMKVDAEMALCLCRPNAFDLIASASTVQWFNSPTRFLQECLRVCTSGAYVAVSTFVPGNLENVSAITGRTLPMLTAKEWSMIIPDGFELVTMEESSCPMEFSNALDAFRHLKLTGVNSLGRTAGGETNLSLTIRRFQPDLDGVYRLVYRPLIFILRKK